MVLRFPLIWSTRYMSKPSGAHDIGRLQRLRLHYWALERRRPMTTGPRFTATWTLPVAMDKQAILQ